MDVQTGQQWRDDSGDAEVLAVFICGKVRYAALRRSFASGKHANRPFLFVAKSMTKGDDGWRLVSEAGGA